MSNKQDIKIGIVIGEHSGDILGSKIIESLKKEFRVNLIGVGGPLTEKHGLKSIFDYKDLHVMGLIEPLLNIRKLLNHRKLIIETFKFLYSKSISIEHPCFTNENRHQGPRPIYPPGRGDSY